MRVWAIVPQRPFARASESQIQVPPTSQDLVSAESLYRRSIEILLNTLEIAGITVLSRDTKVLAIAREYRLHTIQECGTPRLNASLQRAAEILRLQGCSEILVLRPNLPLMTPQDIRQIVHLGRYLKTVVVVPDRNVDDTNGLLLTPPGLIPFSFGTGSFKRHSSLAEEAGATVHVYRMERSGLDMDKPGDLEQHRQCMGDEANRRLYREYTGLPQ